MTVQIQEHSIIGSKNTSYHNFTATIDGLQITISAGEYYQAGQLKYQNTNSTILTVTSAGNYEVWVTTQGFVIVPAFTVPNSPIDRLMWFTSTSTEITQADMIQIVS